MNNIMLIFHCHVSLKGGHMHIHLHFLIKKERLQSNPTPRKSAQRPKSNKKKHVSPSKGSTRGLDSWPFTNKSTSTLWAVKSSHTPNSKHPFFCFGGHLQYNQKNGLYIVVLLALHLLFSQSSRHIFWGGFFQHKNISKLQNTYTPKTRLRRFHCQVAAT